MGPQLFRPRYDAAIILLGQATQRQFQALEVEFGILRDTVSLVQNDDRARFGVPPNSARDLCRVALDCIESSHRPTHQSNPTTFQLRMNEEILQSNGRPEKTSGTIRTGSQLFRTKINLQSDPAGAGAPECSARMRVGVVSDFMAAAQDFGDEMRMLFRAPADDEKSRARVEPVQEVEHGEGVRRRGTVVDG